MPTSMLIAGNELRRRLRDRSALMTAFVGPLLLAVILGLAFGSGRTSFVRIVLANEDPSPRAAAVVDGALAAVALPREIEVVRVTDGSVARRAVAGRQAAGALIIHPQFDDFISAVAGPRPPGGLRLPIDLVTRRDQRIGESIVDALQSAMLGRVAAADVTANQVASLRNGGHPATGAAVQPLIDEALELRAPVHIVDDATSPQRGVIGYFGPSMVIIFLFIGAAAGARALMTERQTGTFARLLAAPIRGMSIVTGKVLAILVTGLASMFTVWAVTVVLFHATWGDPIGVLVLCVVTVLAMSGVSMLITVLARDPSQADTATTIITFVLALLGGNFFPPGSLPPSFERATRLTPNGWALQGFGRLAIDGGHLGSVVTPIIVLLVIATVLGGVAFVRLQQRAGSLA